MGSADDGDAAAGFRGKLMATMPNLDKAIEQFEQAMRQLEAAWAQSERNQETISKLSGEAETPEGRPCKAGQ
jgi:prefoldin subunit 5